VLAASGGYAPVTDSLLTARAELDAQNDFGDTALIIASRDGNAELVRRLVAAGASAKLRNQDRVAAVDVAEARGFSQVAEILRER
jgi:ankyrin repeat protein